MIKLQFDTEEKQIELAKQDNEMARINLDILNTENQILQLEERKKEVNQDRQQNEDKVDDAEKKIKENHETPREEDARTWPSTTASTTRPCRSRAS